MGWLKKGIIVALVLVLAWVFIIGPMFSHHQDPNVPSAGQLSKVNNSTANNTSGVDGSDSTHRQGSTLYTPVIIHTGYTATNNYPAESRSMGTGYTTGQRGTEYSSVPPPSSESTPITAEQVIIEQTPITAEKVATEQTPITAEQGAIEATPITTSAAVGSDKNDVSSANPSEQPAAEVAEETGLGALISEALEGSGNGESSEQSATGASEETGLGALISEVLGGGSESDAAPENIESDGAAAVAEPAEGSNMWSDIDSNPGDIGDGTGDSSIGDVSGDDTSGGDVEE